MPDRTEVLSQYLAAVRSAIDGIEAMQLPAIREAAALFATAILKGRLVHVFVGHRRVGPMADEQEQTDVAVVAGDRHSDAAGNSWPARPRHRSG